MNLVGTHVPVCLFNFGARPGWKRPRGRLGPLGKSSKRTTFGSKWLSIDQLSSISIFSIIFSTHYFIRKSSKRTTFVSEWLSNALTKYLVVRCPTRLSVWDSRSQHSRQIVQHLTKVKALLWEEKIVFEYKLLSPTRAHIQKVLFTKQIGRKSKTQPSHIEGRHQPTICYILTSTILHQDSKYGQFGTNTVKSDN